MNKLCTMWLLCLICFFPLLFFPPDPRFIGVNLIPESDNPEDDKIFLFFKENAMDGEHTGKATIARIGQLCKVTAHTQSEATSSITCVHGSSTVCGNVLMFFSCL